MNYIAEDRQAELRCLAENIYFEASAESMKGKIAVGNVTRNRLESKKFPNTYCGVIKQGYRPGKRNCQFSWFCDGKPDTIWVAYKDGEIIEDNLHAWQDAVVVASLVMMDNINDITKGSLHYYNHNLVYPRWASAYKTLVIIGNHTFKE